MRWSGRIALAFALALSGSAYGQTVEEARQQMLLHKGQLLPPRPETIHLFTPQPLSPAQERELEDALDQRSRGVLLTALGGGLEGVALGIAMFTSFARMGAAIGGAFCSIGSIGTMHDCKDTTNWNAYYYGAAIVAIVGAVPLVIGVPTLLRGADRVRAARGLPVSIAPAAGSGFAGVSATFTF